MIEEKSLPDNLDKSINADTPVKAVLVSVSENDEASTEASLDELERLLETAGATVAARVVQNRHSPDVKTYVGSGKAAEIAELVKNNGDIGMVVFDNELTPSQIRNLEEIIGADVIDRSMLILDIFALHAATSEGKLQVEIACLRYTAPRLIGKGKDLSRLGGGIGTRGPGESKLETDRRHLKRRIDALSKELEEMEKTRGLQHTAREKKEMMTAAVAGYTNAGKSTLLNYLTNADILAQDKLFATLDPTTRILTLPDGNRVLLTDTVGFIDRLPHHLVKAFKSTLDEVKYADLIIILEDASESAEERKRKANVTYTLLEQLGASEKEIITVYNKIDAAEDVDFIPKDALKISAKNGYGVDKLVELLQEKANGGKKTLQFFFPHSASKDAAFLHGNAVVSECRYTDNGTYMTAKLEVRLLPRFEKYLV